MRMRLPTEADGSLSAYVWPGGYAIGYLDQDNCTLCPSCATKAMTSHLERMRPCAWFYTETGEHPSECEDCGKDIK